MPYKISISTENALIFEISIFLTYFVQIYANLDIVYNKDLISPWDQKCNGNILQMLKPGDLIEFDRRSYRHWSVFEGDGYVVQYNGEGLHKIHLAEVVRVQLKEVVNGSRCRINNRFDREKPPLTAKETLLRAKKRLGERKYHVLNNNCEHFAKWCRNDHQHSAQTKILDLLEDYTLMDLSQNIYLNKLGIGQISWADAIRAGYEVFHHMSDQQKEEL